MSYDEDTFPFDEETYDTIESAIETYVERQSNSDAAAGHSYIGDQDAFDLEQLGYETEELERGVFVGYPVQIAEFGDTFAVDQDVLISPWWMKELKIKRPKHGAVLWDEGETLEGGSAHSALGAWLFRNGYQTVDRLSGSWPGGSEQEISVEHVIDYLAGELKVDPEWIDYVGADMHGTWWGRGYIPWASSDGDITMYALPKREHRVVITVEMETPPTRGFMGDMSGDIGGDRGDLRGTELTYDPAEKVLTIEATFYSSMALDKDEVKETAEVVFDETAADLYPEIWRNVDYVSTKVANPGQPPVKAQSTKKLKTKLLR